MCKTKIRSKKRSVCIGDLKDLIKVKGRLISPPESNGVDYDLDFQDFFEVYAMIETRNGVEIFDGTNLKGIATHYFYIRYMPDISISDMVEFRDKNYTIIDIQNLEERNEFILLRCSKRGSSTIGANFTSVP